MRPVAGEGATGGRALPGRPAPRAWRRGTSRSSRAGPLRWSGALRPRAGRRRRDRPVELRRHGATRCSRPSRPSCAAGCPRAGAAATRAPSRRARTALPARAPRPSLCAAPSPRAGLHVRASSRTRPAGPARSRRRGSRPSSSLATAPALVRAPRAGSAGSACSRSRRRCSPRLARRRPAGRRWCAAAAASAGSCADAPVGLGAGRAAVRGAASTRVARSGAASRIFAWLAALAWFWPRAPATRSSPRCSRRGAVRAQRDGLRPAAVPLARARSPARCVLAFLCTGPRRGRRAGALRRRVRRAGARGRRRRWAAPARRLAAGACCRGRPGRSRATARDTVGRRPRLGHALSPALLSGRSRWRCSQVRAPRASYWRAVVLAGFDGLRFARAAAGPSPARPGAATCELLTRRAGPRLRAAGAGGGAERPVPRRSGSARPRTRCPLTAGRGLSRARTAPQFRERPARARPRVHHPRASDAEPIRAGARGAALRLSRGEVVAQRPELRRRADPGVRRRRPRAGDWPRSSGRIAGDPGWRAWQVAYAKARAVTRGAASPYQAVVALEAWLRTSRAYDEHAALPDRPDALARWAASGRAGYCQMFAASLAALDAPLGRARPRRRGVRARRPARRRLPRDRPRRARLGRGLVPRLRLAALRRHAGARRPCAGVVVLDRVRRPRGAGATERRCADDRRRCSSRWRSSRPRSRRAGLERPPPAPRGGARRYALAAALAAALVAALIGLKRALLRSRAAARPVRSRAAPHARRSPPIRASSSRPR